MKKMEVAFSFTEMLASLFQQDVIETQHTGCTLEGEVRQGNPTLSGRLEHNPPHWSILFTFTAQLQYRASRQFVHVTVHAIPLVQILHAYTQYPTPPTPSHFIHTLHTPPTPSHFTHTLHTFLCSL